MGTEKVVRRDLEGDLLQEADASGAHYAKRLSLDVAWHTNAPKDLADWLDALVNRIEQDWPRRLLTIHYNPFLKPVTGAQLHAMLRPSEPLAAWRLAQVAADLCHWLEQFHAAGFPQLVVHPGRIGQMDGQFALFPTLAGILPPLSKLLPQPAGIWLFFIAPEVLRTRGSDPELLPKGDVYALGRTLQVLINPDWTECLPVDPYIAAEQIVESPDLEPPFVWPDGFDEIAKAVDKMCAALPEDRPAATDLVTTFHALARQLEPERMVQSLIEKRKLAEAEAHLKALEASQDEGIFAFPKAKIHILRAKVAMAHAVPQYVLAIDQLAKAKGFEPRSAEAYRQIGRVYREFKEHPQHLKLADLNYRHAARLSGWRTDIVEEWVDVLQQGDPKLLLERTDLIPWDRRPAVVFARRAAGHMDTDNVEAAWHECVDYFSQFGFNQTVFETAQQAAAYLPAAELLIWMRDRQNIEKLPAVQAIVWARNGQHEKAAMYLAHALRMSNEEV